MPLLSVISNTGEKKTSFYLEPTIVAPNPLAIEASQSEDDFNDTSFKQYVSEVGREKKTSFTF